MSSAYQADDFVREPCPPDVLAALEHGELTQDELRNLIAWEAGLTGLSYEQAVAAYQDGSLPRTPLGSDIDLLLRMVVP